jgi:hypothetical protein
MLYNCPYPPVAPSLSAPQFLLKTPEVRASCTCRRSAPVIQPVRICRVAFLSFKFDVFERGISFV